MTANMTATVLAICAAYVVVAVLLLSMGLTAKLAWWVKATAIVVTSGFFVEAFFATKSLLGWPANGQLPPQFQLLWSRVVEPDPKVGERGAVYLWVEEVDENNVPTCRPACRARFACRIRGRWPTARSRRATRSYPASRRKAPPKT
jgi:hypothetical protein